MKPSHPPLELPAQTGVRVLLQLDLRAAVEAVEQLGREDDPEAVRRLEAALADIRDHLRMFEAYLGARIAKKERRRLDALVGAVQNVADRQRWIHRLNQWAEAGEEGKSAAEEWLARHLEPEIARGLAVLRAGLLKHFPLLSARVQRLAASYVVIVDSDRLEPPPSTRTAIAEGVDRCAARLAFQLPRIRAASDHTAIGRARTSARRLHHLLTPFAAEHPNVADLAESVGALLRWLADLRDVEMLRVRTAARVNARPAEPTQVRAELARLQNRLQHLQQHAFTELAEAPLAANVSNLLARSGEVVRLLKGEQASDVEIERKYLLREMPALPDGADQVWIEQGWIPGERLLERVRSVSSATGQRWYRTIKLGRGVRRLEIEEETSREIFDALWRLTEGRRIRKRRFRVPADGGVWEIDLFADLNLVLAEIELDSAEAPVRFPDWLAAVVEREVTEDPAYVNANLAR